MSYRFNSSALRKATSRISATMQASRKAQFRAVNRVAASTRTAGSKKIRDEVRLKASYINEYLRVTRKATENNPEAVITGRKRPTRLARYGAKQLTAVARSGRASGDSTRSIPSGRKQAGVSVAVSRRGSRKKMRQAFLVPLRNGNGMGVFIRTGSGQKDIEHLYGPSVDQVFRSIREDLKPDVRRNLVSEYRRQLAYAQEQGGM